MQEEVPDGLSDLLVKGEMDVALMARPESLSDAPSGLETLLRTVRYCVLRGPSICHEE